MKTLSKNIKKIHFGHACAAIILQSVAIYFLCNEKYQQFFFYSFFALVNLIISIFRSEKEDLYHQILTESGEIDKTVFTLDFNSPKQIINILNMLRFNTTLDRVHKIFLNVHDNIALIFLPTNTCKSEIDNEFVYSTPP